MASEEPPDDDLPRVGRGQRAVLVGRTGSGKTTLSRWLLRRAAGAWIILNTKGERSFADLPYSVSTDSFDLAVIETFFDEHKFIVVNPPDALNNPQDCDLLIQALQRAYEDIGLCVDELYQTQVNGQAGPGIIGWLTRGRSLRQSFIGCTQRPAWVSRFVFSEADYYGIAALNLRDDRKRVYEFVGDEDALSNPPERYQFRWYSVATDKLELYQPVPERS